ncbi:hypothetical protein [Stigmatella aurantiaca]|uniref:hypothetical protein n=1 Tax=Stigmatella aurantiaca TaxID=41 RepID=UPI0015A680BF|nr:hypothetical protein [Stigmatella aurantiaca]
MEHTPRLGSPMAHLDDELATGGLDDQKRELQAPLTISAILDLVELRLHQVERVLRGAEDPLCCCGRRRG